MITALFKADITRLDALDRAVPTNVNLVTRQLASRVVEEIRSNWSEESPSSPGAPPAVVTGTLDASVVAEPTGRDALGRFAKDASVWLVRISAPYAGFLERGTYKMAARPYVIPAVLRAAEDVADAYREAISFKVLG